MRRLVSSFVIILIVAGVIAAWRTGYVDGDRLEAVRRTVRAIRELPLAPVLFVLAYALIVVLLLPTTVASIAAGAVFGFVGFPMAWTGAMLGSAVAYVLGRYTGRRLMERFLGRHPLLERMRNAASTWDIVRLRVIPAAPFGVLDYLAGMTSVPLLRLLIATGVGVLPTMIAYVYAGAELGRAVETGGSATRALIVAGIVTMIVAAVSILPTVIRRLSGRFTK